MSREITVAGAPPGTTLCIQLAGEYSFATLLHGDHALATAFFDDSTQPAKFIPDENRPSVRIGRTYFQIPADEAPRLQAWMAEVRA